MDEYHPGHLRLPIVRVLGGARFDDHLEACLGNFYLRPLITQWLINCIGKPECDNGLQRALYIQLTSVEMIAQLRIGAIIYISIFVPMRWLAANTHKLGHRKWGEKSMARAINLVYLAAIKIRTDSTLILNEDFMMNILTPISNKVLELKDYLEWYFEEKRTLVHNDYSVDSRKSGIDIVRSELFYPEEKSNRETTHMCEILGEEVGDIIVVECEDKGAGKVTHQYIGEYPR